jgi:hypothetical protein
MKRYRPRVSAAVVVVLGDLSAEGQGLLLRRWLSSFDTLLQRFLLLQDSWIRYT